MSGSIVTSGSGYAKVISVGKNSYASNLIKEASEVSDNSSYLQRTINTILKIVTVLIIPVGILLFISQYFHSNQTYSEAILSTVAGIIGMIPEGLVLLTSIALTAGVIKMAKKNVIIQKLHGIEVLSCTDVLCLDKTGTITDGTMTVVDTIVLDKRVNIANIIANINTEEGNNSTDIALKNKYGIKNDLKHTAGVLSMARAMNPNSAGSQFFIMHQDAPHLDGSYAAFGKVIEGMENVNKIAECPTDHYDRPYEDQIMKNVTVETFGVEYPEPETM